MKLRREDMGFRVLGDDALGLDITERQALGMGMFDGEQTAVQQLINLFGSSIIALFPMGDLTGTVMTDVVNARNGAYAGASGVLPTLAQPSLRDGGYSVWLPGANAKCNAFTTALRDAVGTALIGASGALTIMADIKVNALSVWSDGVVRYVWRFAVDANNYTDLYVDGRAGAGDLVLDYKAGGGVTQTRAKTDVNEIARMHVALTVSRADNRARLYYNGVQQGADLTSSGNWAGTLAQAMFGEYSASNNANGFHGWMQNALILNREATPAEVASVNSFSLGAVDAPAAGGFSVVFVPDTQAMTSAAANRACLDMMMDWIVENKTALNIQAVMTEGDVVETVGAAAEWTAADASYDILDTDGTIPYLIAAGDHDYDDATNHVATTFNANFGQARYTGQSWWAGGFYEADHSENAYNVITIDSVAYLFIILENNPRADVLTWLDGLLTTHADKKAIIVTHKYLQSDNTRDTAGGNVWNKVKLHDNVIWVGCGNYVDPDGYGRLTSQSDGGKNVHQVLFDTQSLVWGGPWLRVVKFHPGGNIVSETYSPVSREKKTDSDNQFTLAWPA